MELDLSEGEAMLKTVTVNLQRATSNIASHCFARGQIKGLSPACGSLNPKPRSLPGLLEELAQRQQVFSENGQMTPEKVQEILKKRAQSIRAADLKVDEGDLLDVLEFTLGDEHYAFALKWVIEVCKVSEITEIPGTPAFVKGVINFRSRIYSVIDLSTLMALPVHSDESSTSVGYLLLILASEEMEFAVRIDRLEGVRSLPFNSLQSHLATLEGAQAKYFKGVTADQLVLLDAEKLLTDKKIVVE